MSARLQDAPGIGGPADEYDFGDAVAREADAIRCSGSRMARIDYDTSELLDTADYVEMFSVLADLSDCGAVKRLAEGVPADRLNALQLDTFARLARLADRISLTRDGAVEDEARAHLGVAA